MSVWLGIDGALGAFSAALVGDDESEPRVAIGAGKDALERGLSLVHEALGTTRLRDLTGIAVGIGPGSFTGLRIALGYAKSLAFAANVPLAAVSSYDALVAADADEAGACAEIVHGRAGIACARLRRPQRLQTIVCGDYVAIADALAAEVGGDILHVSPGAPAGAVSALSERGIIVQVSPSRAHYTRGSDRAFRAIGSRRRGFRACGARRLWRTGVLRTRRDVERIVRAELDPRGADHPDHLTIEPMTIADVRDVTRIESSSFSTSLARKRLRKRT